MNRESRRVAVFAGAVAAALALVLPGSAFGYSYDWSVTGTGMGDPPVFDYTTDRCPPANPDDYPDLNLGAFRFWNAQLGAARVQLNFPGAGVQNRRMVGPDLSTVKREWQLAGTEGVGSPPNCGVGGEIVFRAPRVDLADPARYTNWEWLGPPYYESSNGKVYAPSHNEFRGQNAGVPAGCASGSVSYWPDNCWDSSVTLLVSDGTTGATSNKVGGQYDHPGMAGYPPDPSGYLIATVPYQYWHDWGRVGYWSPSNTIKVGDYYYVMTLATGPIRDASGSPYASAQKPGMCVLRTDNLDDASSWRAWGGRAFDVTVPSPYTSALRPDEHVCEPVSPAELGGLVGRSLTYNTYLGKYMLVLSSPDTPPATLYSTSEDLINWSKPQVMVVEDATAPDGCPDDTIAYAAILDPDHDPAATADPRSTTANLNFNLPSRKPYLYFVRFNKEPPACAITRDRDIARIPLEFNQRIATLSNGLTESSANLAPRGFDATSTSYALGPVGCNPPSCFPDYDGDARENSLFTWVIAQGTTPQWGYGRIGQTDAGTGGMPLRWQNGDDVWYSAAFYLPATFLTQNTTVDLMQWQTASGENGGVSLGTGDKLSAMRGATGIGQDFTPPLGRWFWLEVHQKLGASAGGGTLSEVFLDGRLVSSTSAANRSGSDPILRVSYGLVKAMLPPGGHAYAFVDRASVTTGPMGPLIFAAGPGSAGLVGVPKAPTGMRFGTPSGGSAPLNWNAAAAGDPTVDGYRIYQRQGDGSWAPAPVATTTGTSAVEPCGATYRVAAYRNFGFNDNTGSPSGESLYSADVGC